jgi:hypothetical protein
MGAPALPRKRVAEQILQSGTLIRAMMNIRIKE